MKLLALLESIDRTIRLDQCKVHLATSSEQGQPLVEFMNGTFDAWQAIQTKKNFERDHVLSFIQLPERALWLFAGAFDNNYSAHFRPPYEYHLSRREDCESLVGRLVVRYDRRGRQSYLLSETALPNMTVHEIRAERLVLEEFPGFKDVLLPFSSLCVLARQNAPSWTTVLSSVSGVYLLSDRLTGQHYVGSATGADRGIWGRWCDYTNGHGNNQALKELISAEGVSRADDFRFSILEVADIDATVEHVRRRERHWKEVLMSQEFGLNRNS